MFFINDKCLFLFTSAICLTSAFNVFVVPDQEEDEVKVTDMPTEEIPTSTEDLSEFEDITMDVGEYTTDIYQYEHEQYMALNEPKDRCWDDYNKCLTSMISGFRPVCAFHSQFHQPPYEGIRTFRTTCDIYFDNCLREHRHWRILDYGRCIETYPRWYNSYLYPWNEKNFDVERTK